MKKKVFLLTTLMGTVSVLAALLIKPATSRIQSVSSHQNSYVFTLDNTNNGFLPTSTGSGQSTNSNCPRTVNNNPINFAYTNSYKYSTYAIRMYKNSGSLSNVSPFTGLRSVTIQIPSGSVSIAYGSTYGTYGDPITVTSGVRYEVDSKPYFKITAGASTAYINSIKVEYVCDGSGSLEPLMDHVHHGYHYLAKEPTADNAGNLEFYACEECSYASLTKEDSGIYVDSVLSYDLPSDHIAYVAPLFKLRNDLLRKPAQFDYPIAVNLEVPSEGYQADNTGNTDASTIIQDALNYVSNVGGGTLYLASGKYLLNNQITIPERVTLVGEFNGTNANNYGTVLLCNKSYSSSDTILNNTQIRLSSDAGINGITFYYPNQNINSVTEFGYTIYSYNNLTSTMSNLFFINSYKGVAVNSPTDGMGELVNIENIYGTFLNEGISGFAQSDVGYWNNINLSPSYYENALSEYRCANSTALYKYVRTHLTALILGDLDDFSLNKINIDNAEYGIYFPAECRRPEQAFWGFLNDVHLTDCVTGVYAERIFSSGAALFTHSSLGKVINNAYEGRIKLSKCEYIELLGNGETMIEKGSETYEAAPTYDDTNTFNISNNLYYLDDLDDTGVTDVSEQLQEEINKCTLGGVIVLKNGTYRLNNPITIPANVMLTSFANTFCKTRSTESKSNLVKFISYSNDSCVKLSDFSGIQGIRIYNVYKDPDVAYSTLTASNTDPFVAIKAVGNNSFAINCEATYTFTGFDFTNSSNHYIKYCYGCAYDTLIKVGSFGKTIACLNNLNFLARNCLHNFAQANTTAIEKYFDFESESKDEEHTKVLDITRSYTTLIKVNNSNELLLNCFAYGVSCLINSTSSTLLAINTSLDNLKDENYCYVINGGSAKIANTFRVFGKSFNLVSGSLEIYGRYDFSNKREKYYNSSTSSNDDPVPFNDGLVEEVLSNCENNTGVSGATRNSSYKYQGSYSWRSSSTSNPAIAYTFTSKDISSYMRNGYIRFYVYCSNYNSRGEFAFIELTSGGTCDVDEITMNLMKQIKKQGWNEIVVKLSDMENGPGNFNPKALNYFRFYVTNCSGYYYVDYISFFHTPAPTNQILINDCENTDNTNGVSNSEFRVEGSYSWKANDSVNAVFACTFAQKDISAYISDGYLDFYLYVPHLSMLGNTVYVELTSSGNCDVEEITNSAKEYITEDGWNYVHMPLSAFWRGSNNGTFDSTACNFFRLYTLNSTTNVYLDNVRLVK